MSNYFDILSAVADSVATVVPNTVLRRKLFKLETDAVPLVIVAPGEQGEKIAGQQFNKGVWYAYPVVVAYVEASNRLMTQGLEQWLDTREAIRNQLFQTLLSGAAVVFDTNMNPDSAIKFGAYLGSNFDVSGWELSFKVAEERLS